MCALETAPAEACAPDADRDGADAPDLMPKWTAYLVALLIVLVIELVLAFRPRRQRTRSAARVDKPARSPDAALPAVSDDASIDATIVRECRARGVAPEDADAAELYRKIKAIFARIAKAQGAAAALNPVANAADVVAAPAAPRVMRHDRRMTRSAAAGDRRGIADACRRSVLARTGAGPPIGPPAGCEFSDCCA